MSNKVRYVLKRLLFGALLLLGVSVIIYTVVRMMPADYIDQVTAAAVQSGSMTLDDVQHLKDLLGIGDNSFAGILKGYLMWLSNAMRGDFGISFVYGMPVTQVIAKYMWLSFILAFISYILEIVISIPLGIKAAVKQYGSFDYAATVLAMMGISLPSFFLSTLMINAFSIKLKIFPVTGLITATKFLTGFPLFLDKVHHLILPMVVLTILSIGPLMRYQRTNMLEVLNSDYIRTARAKGVPERSVIYKHTFRNTLIPLVTRLSAILPSLFGGMMILEGVFAIPGIGQKALSATTRGDIPFVMGYNMFLAVLTVLGYIISDMMYAVVDPRVELK